MNDIPRGLSHKKRTAFIVHLKIGGNAWVDQGTGKVIGVDEVTSPADFVPSAVGSPASTAQGEWADSTRDGCPRRQIELPHGVTKECRHEAKPSRKSNEATECPDGRRHRVHEAHVVTRMRMRRKCSWLYGSPAPHPAYSFSLYGTHTQEVQTHIFPHFTVMPTQSLVLLSWAILEGLGATTYSHVAKPPWLK